MAFAKPMAPGLAALVLLAVACTAAPQPAVFTEITFADRGPIVLDVGTVEIRSSFEPSFADPDVEHLFPIPPQRAAERWARDRLVAHGGGRRAVFDVKTARVVERPLSGVGGVAGLFKTDQEARYLAVLEVELLIEEPDGRRAGFVSAKAERARTVEEGVTLAEREAIWFAMTEQLMADLDPVLEDSIRTRLAGFVIR
ncbi:MAG: hypothetical protein HOH66_14620 [Rhodospirillaceae bacterium]|jgi:hypothetical protein|nr:hypothetical protein [Rhodospirillaceae bacterium]